MIINVEQGAANPSVGTLLRTSVSLNLVPALVPNSVRSGPHPGLPQPSGG